MLRALPALIGIVLAVYCLVDLVQAQVSEVRLLPRWAWALIIIAIPIVGPIGWLTLGRPQNPSSSYTARPPASGSAPGRAVAPDDDPEFLAQLKRQRAQREQEEKLRAWEQELKKREQQLDKPAEGPASDEDGEAAAPDQPAHPADDDPGGTSSNGR